MDFVLDLAEGAPDHLWDRVDREKAKVLVVWNGFAEASGDERQNFMKWVDAVWSDTLWDWVYEGPPGRAVWVRRGDI